MAARWRIRLKPLNASGADTKPAAKHRFHRLASTLRLSGVETRGHAIRRRSSGAKSDVQTVSGEAEITTALDALIATTTEYNLEILAALRADPWLGISGAADMR
jgi:hypothetical protein